MPVPSAPDSPRSFLSSRCPPTPCSAMPLMAFFMKLRARAESFGDKEVFLDDMKRCGALARPGGLGLNQGGPGSLAWGYHDMAKAYYRDALNRPEAEDVVIGRYRRAGGCDVEFQARWVGKDGAARFVVMDELADPVAMRGEPARLAHALRERSADFSSRQDVFDFLDQEGLYELTSKQEGVSSQEAFDAGRGRALALEQAREIAREARQPQTAKKALRSRL